MPDGWSKPDYKKTPAPEGGFDSWALASLTALGKGGSKHLGNLRAGAASAEIRSGPTSVWLVVRWPEDAAIALRCGYWPEAGLAVEDVDRREGTVTITATSPSASSTVEIAVLGEEPSLLRATVRMTPKIPLIPSFWPRDIYPLDQNNGPIETAGVVYAKQRESAVGIVYAAQTEPGKGTFLYLQNLTALNDFCRLSETNLRECVGGAWPSLGISLQPARSPIPTGREIVVSDAFIALTPGATDDEGQVALTFLDGIAAIYPHLEQPEPERHDWPWRSEETLKALMDVEELMVEKFGGRYVRPYLGAEIPDSTVQLAVLLPALDYSEWRGDEQPPELLDELRDSLNPFYDKNVGSIVRYLPDSNTDGGAVDADHNRWKIDSWYLYRPMMQLANLADRGNESERDLFLNSLDYGMEVAHHFKYQWPINFSTITLEPVETERDSEVPAQLGETDVAGLYAYTMLDAQQLTGEDKYLDEAQAALDRMRGLGFEIGYQFSNVAWGMAAAIRLWQLRHDDEHLERACVLMASLIQHSQLWESECGPARHFPNFFGVNCLRDAAYSAPFEEFEIYLAFHEVLRAGGELPRSIVLLIGEYCRHVLNRAWYYYPSELPEEAIATEQRQGRIDRGLSMPLEDLYIDGQPMGQVGQEVYGCGLAFILATRAFIPLHESKALLYCDYPILDANIDERRASLVIGGHPSGTCMLEVVGGDHDLKATVTSAPADGSPPERVRSVSDDHRRFRIPGGSYVIVTL